MGQHVFKLGNSKKELPVLSRNSNGKKAVLCSVAPPCCFLPDGMGESEPTFTFAHAVERLRDRGGTQMPKNNGFLTKRLQVGDQTNHTKSQLETPNKGDRILL